MLFAVALLLTAHGDSPTREEKFRGALVTEASPEVRGSATPVERTERETLLAARPDLDPAMNVMGVSIGLTLLGAVLLPFGFVGEGAVWFFVIGAVLTGTAVLCGLITGVVLIVLGAEVRRVDARVRELEAAKQTGPTAEERRAQSGVVLAGF